MRSFTHTSFLALGSLMLLGFAGPTTDEGDTPSQVIRDRALLAADTGGPSAWTFAVDPKPLSQQVQRGLDWLAAHQHVSGGWGQGDAGGQPSGTPNVGDTCAAGLAFLRAGHAPDDEGDFATNLLGAVDFVAAEIAASDPDSLSVSSVQGTRLQSKLGPYVDTFLASLFLSELQGRMPDEDAEQQVRRALATVVDKIATHQRDDGTWDDRGWAPVLSQSIAAKGLNRAVQGGYEVDADVLGRMEANARQKVTGDDLRTDGEGSAGVALYMAGSVVSTLQDSVNSNAQRERELEEIVAAAPASDEAAEALEQLGYIEEGKRVNASAQDAIVRRLDDPSFVAGFGSNGGEEYLSYMNISESLVVEAGDEWLTWDERMTANLNRVQNEDGSWSGHHCITGRTFCTASALLVLMADRTPIPVATQDDVAGGEGDGDDAPETEGSDDTTSEG